MNRELNRTMVALAELFACVALAGCGGAISEEDVASADATMSEAERVRLRSIDSIAPTVGISAVSEVGSTGLTGVSGTAADNVRVLRVKWSNDRGGNGTASLNGRGTAATWSVPSIQLQAGVNRITVTAEDVAGNTAATSTVISRSDAAAPAPAPVPAPAPTPVAATTAWVKIANEGVGFTVSTAQRVRYGSGTTWIERTTSGAGQCTNGFFGTDPLFGVVKQCDLLTTAAATAPAPAPLPAPTPATAPAPAPVAAPAPAPVAASTSTTAAIQATRTAGPAPLAALFDSTGTSAASGVDAFRQITYSYNFGDDRGQTWAVSGLPKNTQTGGPISAHVFDVPGTYVVKVRATDAAGAYSDASVTVTVDNPDAFYAATKTVCVSTSSNYAGCPNGAAQQTSLPSSYSGKRVLLRRGESFGAINIAYADHNVQVGAFGTGAKPQVPTVDIGGGTPNGVFPDDITIMDLNVATYISQYTSASRLLFYRNSLNYTSGTNDAMMFVGDALDYFVGAQPGVSFFNPREIFIVENTVVGNTSANGPNYNFFGMGSRVAMLGNDMGTARQHTARLIRLHKSVIAHNALRGRSEDGTKLSLKLHSGGLRDYNDSISVSGTTWASSQIVIANNLFGDANDNNAWTVAVAPQNAQYTEGLEYVILENSRFARGPRTNTDILRVGRRITTRGNVRVDGGALNIGDDGQAWPAIPAEWKGPYY